MRLVSRKAGYLQNNRTMVAELFDFRMKMLLFAGVGFVSLLSGCVSEHHYHPVERVPVSTRSPKAAPNLNSDSASDFRAVEKPPTYSQ
jgi:hypothetical protein